MQRHSVSIVGGLIVDTTTEDVVDAEIERLKQENDELRHLGGQHKARIKELEGISK